jgi:hypothetical protein
MLASCLRPSDYGLDDDIGVELRDKTGTTLDAQKVVVKTRDKQGTTQDETKTSYKQTERRFCFEGIRDGDYLLAFVFHKNGVSTSGRIPYELLAQPPRTLRLCVHGRTNLSEIVQLTTNPP